jgi:hypothetical protein
MILDQDQDHAKQNSIKDHDLLSLIEYLPICLEKWVVSNVSRKVRKSFENKILSIYAQQLKAIV